MVMISRR